MRLWPWAPPETRPPAPAFRVTWSGTCPECQQPAHWAQHCHPHHSVMFIECLVCGSCEWPLGTPPLDS